MKLFLVPLVTIFLVMALLVNAALAAGPVEIGAMPVRANAPEAVR